MHTMKNEHTSAPPLGPRRNRWSLCCAVALAASVPSVAGSSIAALREELAAQGQPIDDPLLVRPVDESATGYPTDHPADTFPLDNSKSKYYSPSDEESAEAQYEYDEEYEEEMSDAETRASIKRRRLTRFFSTIITLIIYVVFAGVYYKNVVKYVPVRRERKQGVMISDFEQGLFEVCDIVDNRNRDRCLYATCCYWCRAAHTWHAAGVCEYWPALFLLALASMVKWTCCVEGIIFAYFRMKTKDQLNIKTDVMNDCLVSIFCTCCAVGQEGMAIDVDRGTDEVSCCCRVSQQPVVGGQESDIILRGPMPQDEEEGQEGVE